MTPPPGTAVALGAAIGVVVTQPTRRPSAHDGHVWVRFGNAEHPTHVRAELLTTPTYPPNQPGPVRGTHP